jgi:hypothetical protein
LRNAQAGHDDKLVPRISSERSEVVRARPSDGNQFDGLTACDGGSDSDDCPQAGLLPLTPPAKAHEADAFGGHEAEPGSRCIHAIEMRLTGPSRSRRDEGRFSCRRGPATSRRGSVQVPLLCGSTRARRTVPEKNVHFPRAFERLSAWNDGPQARREQDNGDSWTTRIHQRNRRTSDVQEKAERMAALCTCATVIAAMPFSRCCLGDMTAASSRRGSMTESSRTNRLRRLRNG